MGKINQAKEKVLKNEAYALKIKALKKKEEKPANKKEKVEKKLSTFANWCRTEGHPPSCWVLSCPQK